MSHKSQVSILLVDDRPENLLALESLLEAPDLVIVTATSGQEALGLMLEYDFALVLLDVQMPEMDGFETAALMRSSQRTRSIPIIFITAVSKEQEYVFKGYEIGAVDYLFKPVNPDILLGKVSVFCELYRQNKRIIQKKTEEIEEKDCILERQQIEIKTLKGLLAICAHCNRIRNEEGDWEVLEVYIRNHSEAEFSHGICPACCRELYPEYAAKIEQDRRAAAEETGRAKGV